MDTFTLYRSYVSCIMATVKPHYLCKLLCSGDIQSRRNCMPQLAKYKRFSLTNNIHSTKQTLYPFFLAD